jgi:hypothetical protein
MAQLPGVCKHRPDVTAITRVLPPPRSNTCVLADDVVIVWIRQTLPNLAVVVALQASWLGLLWWRQASLLPPAPLSPSAPRSLLL